MKLQKFLYVMLPLCMMFTACDSDDTSNDGNTATEGDVPEATVPSTEFSPNNLPAEPFAEDAIRIVADNEGDAPFYSLELMPDGNYLLCASNPSASYAPAVNVKAEANGSFSVFKPRKSKAVRTRSTTNENGTMYLGDGMEYGKFTKLGNKKYRLSSGIEVDLQNATGSNGSITYKGTDGVLFTVYVNVSEHNPDNATRSICRAWNTNSIEVWGYFNDKCVAHGKQSLTNGKVESFFEASNGGRPTIGDKTFVIERGDFLDDDDEFCYKTVFTQYGTYISFYMDGDSEVSLWSWKDKSQGTLHFIDYGYTDEGEEFIDNEYLTVRFSGNQMRIYGDMQDNIDIDDVETDMTERIVSLVTLTAAN